MAMFACNTRCCVVVTGNNIGGEGAEVSKALAASLEENTVLTSLSIFGKHCCECVQ